MKKEVKILLPDTLYIKSAGSDKESLVFHEEFNIYFKNIIRPLSDMWDIRVECEYGENLGKCFRLSDFSEDVSEFDLAISVYGEYGERLAEKKCLVRVGKRHENKKTKLMFLGDSMTHGRVYVNHIMNSTRGIETVGTRSYDGSVKIEGRGGWSYDAYFTRYFESFGMSPFLFPAGVDAKDYYGDLGFIEKTKRRDTDAYQYYGYDYSEIRDAQYYSLEKKLYRKKGDGEELISEEPEFEFDFGKYLERFGLDTPEIVSVLLGANDLFFATYENSAEKISEYVNYALQFADKIHAVDKNIKIIFNLPIICAEQYAFGKSYGCQSTEKMYRFNIMKAAQRLIETFDNRQSDNIYLCPMSAAIDPDEGFCKGFFKANKYSEISEQRHTDAIHPSRVGYMQMGDALASVIECIR